MAISQSELRRRARRAAYITKLEAKEKRAAQRAAVRAAKARERERKAFVRIAKKLNIKVKREGHGLQKQLNEYRQEISLYRQLQANKRLQSNAAIQAQRDAYASKLNEMAKFHHGVQNPGDLFLSLPISEQNRIIREAEILHEEWLINGQKPLGRHYDPMYCYH